MCKFRTKLEPTFPLTWLPAGSWQHAGTSLWYGCEGTVIDEVFEKTNRGEGNNYPDRRGSKIGLVAAWFLWD